jgi:hypothetical protein
MKKRRRIIAAIVVIIIIVAATIVIKLWPKSNQEVEVKIINQISDYGYVLEDNETKLHQKYFDQLVNTLKAKDVDEEAYAKLVVELFISDFYNLDNKPTQNDVGGIQYVYKTAQDNMALKAKDTIYKYIESNIGTKRDQVLPIVTNVTIDDIKDTSFKYGTATDDKAYEVSASWTYKEDLGYQDKATFTLIHEDNKLSIAELE